MSESLHFGQRPNAGSHPSSFPAVAGSSPLSQIPPKVSVAGSAPAAPVA